MAISSTTKIAIAVGAVALTGGVAYYFVSEAKKKKAADEKAAAEKTALLLANMKTQSQSVPAKDSEQTRSVPAKDSEPAPAPSRMSSARDISRMRIPSFMRPTDPPPKADPPPPPPDPPADPAPSPINPDVLKLQALLKVLGMYNGPVDGQNSTALQQGINKIAPLIGVDPKNLSVPVLNAKIKAASVILALLGIQVPANF